MERLGGGQQLLVVVHALAGGQLDVGAVVDHDVVPDGLELLHQRPEQRQQRAVDEDDLVLGVVGDVDQLLGEQPDVERVQDATGARRGQVQLEVAGRVPAERRHPAVGAHAQGVEDGRQPAYPLGPVRDRRRRLAGRARGDDRLVPEVLLGPVEDVRQREGAVLHESEHRDLPGKSSEAASPGTVPTAVTLVSREAHRGPGRPGAGRCGVPRRRFHVDEGGARPPRRHARRLRRAPDHDHGRAHRDGRRRPRRHRRLPARRRGGAGAARLLVGRWRPAAGRRRLRPARRHRGRAPGRDLGGLPGRARARRAAGAGRRAADAGHPARASCC